MNTNATVAHLFNGEPVRSLASEEGAPLFVATDIAKILGYRDAANMVRVLDDDEVGGTRFVSTPSENQHGLAKTETLTEVTVITESGLYHAIFNSQKQEAKVFRKWVTSEVLPSIRKTGTYTLPEVEVMKKELAALHEAFGMDDPVNGFFAQLNEAKTQRNSLQKSLADLTAKVTVHGTLKKHAVNVLTERDRGIEAARKFVAKELRPALKVTKRLRKLHKDDQITLSLLSDLELSVLRAGWLDEVEKLDE